MKLFELLLIFFIICFIYNNVSSYQRFDFISKMRNDPYFLSKQETIDFFKKDKDKYIENLTEYDLMSLNATSCCQRILML